MKNISIDFLRYGCTSRTLNTTRLKVGLTQWSGSENKREMQLELFKSPNYEIEANAMQVLTRTPNNATAFTQITSTR